MIRLGILFLVCVYIVTQTREPQELIEVKEKYHILRNHLKQSGNETFRVLHKPVTITALRRMNGSVGYNTNKGADITICLDGTVNEIFHVLMHELTHSTVDEYEHSPQFWKNYMDLRAIAIKIGIYQRIENKTAFCGEHIQDK